MLNQKSCHFQLGRVAQFSPILSSQGHIIGSMCHICIWRFEVMPKWEHQLKKLEIIISDSPHDLISDFPHFS